MGSRTNVLIIGHSFIRRLQNDVHERHDLHSNLNLDQCVVQYYGVGGATVASLLHDFRLREKLEEFRPDVVILQIGGNDVCETNVGPETIACRIVDFSEKIGQFRSVKAVVTCELFPRLSPRNISAELYEFRRNIMNNMISVMLEHTSDCFFLFWKHLRLTHSPLPIFLRDGTHLSFIGQKKFYRSIRLSILHALQLI